MKLKILNRNTSTWLQEFDFWITPFLDEVKDSHTFIEARLRMKRALELIGSGNGQFSISDAASPRHITDAVISGISSLEPDDAHQLVYSVYDLLFLVTGRTDNNLKCQFPVYLREVLEESEYPTLTRKGTVKLVSIPRVLSSERMAITVASLINHQAHQRALLFRYIKFILSEPVYIDSLYAIGRSYFLMKSSRTEDELLLPLVVAYVRGSVSASGGHKPEKILRNIMSTWGLTLSEDFNKEDVIIHKPMGSTDKTRAYDFVLPYKVPGWDWRIFIQSQFYAGDSGSVSHKNVDQTSKSRAWVKSQVANPIFIEYVDGAGYYGSLNGDLKRLLEMADTENFIQVRTSPVKLRQILQTIGFLTPLELAHALSLANLDLSVAMNRLVMDGYTDTEIRRVVLKSAIAGLIYQQDATICFERAFRETARRYLLMDGITNQASPIAVSAESATVVLVPGYEHFYGLTLSEIGTLVVPAIGIFATDWSDPAVLLADIDFLADQKWIVLSGRR